MDNLHYEKFQDGTVKCIEDEIPFEVPEGWEWCRISSISIINPRNTLSDDLEVSFVPMTNICDRYSNQFTSDKRIWSKVKTGFTHFAENDIGIAKITPCFENKKSVIFRGLINGYGAGTTELHILRLLTKTIVPEYMLCFVKRDNFITGGVQTFSGDVGQQRVTKDYVANYLVSLPPASEQLRIISKVKEAFAIMDMVETDQADLSKTVSKLKAKILDLAIRGKLVPQDPNDEPASVLLERIRSEKEELIKAGKIKRDKKESVIFKGEDNSYYEKIGEKVHCIDEEIPFEIPDNWAWCRLGVLFQHNTGKALNSSDSDGMLFPYITTSNVYWGRFELENLKTMLFTQAEIDKCTIKKGDLLVCEGGDIGRAAIWDSNLSVMIQNHIHRLRPYCNLNIKLYYYIFWLYKTRGFIEGNGIGLQGLSSNKLHSLLVPLLPLAEQDEIVNRINRLFTIIISVEASLS